MNDIEVVTHQLGRKPRPFRTAVRCPYGLPSVIENKEARNMPTSFWITCPTLKAAISRIESTGGVRAAQESLGETKVSEVHDRHADKFGARVAGVREGGYVKCLHAFTALHISGALPNEVAEWTMQRLEHPYCEDSRCNKGL